ncbi:hypothetical protein RIF29_25739 [Crotalaria pallida]|uniref:Uncharacterized protein n=1 Tax=Crotalaria pallida TaxID=3830 RepID=A0AAN9EP66_CROPI
MFSLRMPLFSLGSATDRPLRRPPPPSSALSSPSGFTLRPTFFLRFLPPPSFLLPASPSALCSSSAFSLRPSLPSVANPSSSAAKPS